VKGDVLPHLLERYPNRVESVDSMAWDFRARKEARAARISNTTSHRSKWLSKWYRSQERKIEAALAREEGRAPLRRPIVYRDPESELGIVSYQAPEPLVEECRLRVERTTRARARALVRAYHRHLPRPPAGEKAAFVVLDPDGVARGAAMIGRPSSRALDKSGKVLEITRTATDGSPNACSALVAACVRYARTEGFSRVVTYTLQGESGSSLRAVGFRLDGETTGGSWDRASREREERSELLEAPKLRWVRDVSTRSSSSRSRPSQIPSSKRTDLDEPGSTRRPVPDRKRPLRSSRDDVELDQVGRACSASRCDIEEVVVRCSICQSKRLEAEGELADFLVLRCLDCGSRRRGEPLEALSADPLSFDPDDTGQGLNDATIDRLERREALLLEALRRIRVELPKVQTQLRELYSLEVA
jgi:hypothetical protein